MNLLTVKQVMDILGISRQHTIYKYIKSGKLKAYRLGEDGNRRHWRIDQSDLEKFVQGIK